MVCKHLEENGRWTRCRAVEGILIPSHFERERYCHGDAGEACPTQRLYTLRGARLTQDLYYQQWVASPDDCHSPAQPQRGTGAPAAHAAHDSLTVE
jgi:hypothetical protein